MSIIGLPSPGDEDWYDYATSLDTEARTIAAKETPAGAQAKADAAQAAAEATASATYETIANVAAIEGRVDTLEAAPSGGSGGTVITQAAYDALVTPDPDTTYLIVG